MQFDLHKLGWKSFEDLVACVLRETLGQTFQVFSDGVDGGRDGAFYGCWTSTGPADTMSGSFCVQCKHTSKAETKMSLSIIENELPKVKRLAATGLADAYLLFTNCSLSAETAAALEEEIRKAGAKQAKIFGAEWLNQSIATKPSLRRLVPRLYGLGDLTQIVTHQAYRQARGVLQSIAPDLECFVPTDAYRQCAHALKDHGFVMLIGDPASGKSMIANLLALSAADEWDLETLILNCPQDLDKKWNADEPKQFFWVDDAFGSNHCDFSRVQEWNQRLPELKAAIHLGARVVFTSRSYIFRAAQSRLNTHKFELLNDSRVTIEIENFSGLEKAMILYNHLKLGKQPATFKTRVKEFLPSVTLTPKFLPEIARRFSNPKFTSKLSTSRAGVSDFFNHPVEVMAEIVRGLASGEKAAVALVFASGGRLPIPLQDHDPHIAKTIASMQSSIGDVKAALSALDDSLLRKTSVSDTQHWQFRHPTIRDAFASDVASNPELVDIYLSGVSKERLIDEISCGDMGIEGVKLIVPPPLYERVLGIVAPKGQAAAVTKPVIAFLAERCSAGFLRMFFDGTAAIGLLEQHVVSANPFDITLMLLCRLNKEKLLPEDVRLKVIERIQRLAELHFSDCFVDGDFVGKLVSAEENAEFLAKQKDVIFSNADEILDEVEADWSVDDDAEDAFYYIRRLVERLQDENEIRYGEVDYDEAESVAATEFLAAIKSKVDGLKQRQSAAESYDELETEDAEPGALPSSRSIFDDVDE
jgi:hypothetical protein